MTARAEDRRQGSRPPLRRGDGRTGASCPVHSVKPEHYDALSQEAEARAARRWKRTAMPGMSQTVLQTFYRGKHIDL